MNAFHNGDFIRDTQNTYHNLAIHQSMNDELSYRVIDEDGLESLPAKLSMNAHHKAPIAQSYLTIQNASVVEGDSHEQRYLEFLVSLSHESEEGITFDFTTDRAFFYATPTTMRLMNEGASYHQFDDVQIIADKLGWREDRHFDDIGNASLLHIGQGHAGEGIINSTEDKDLFKLTTNDQISLDIAGVSGEDKGGSLDILARLLDRQDNVLYTAAPKDSLNAKNDFYLANEKTVYL